MNSRLRGFLIAVLLVLDSWAPLVGAQPATTYHVASTGSDTVSCPEAKAPATPRRTINGGIGCLGHGDTLLIGEGEYPELLVGSINGTTSYRPSALLTVQPHTNMIPVGTATRSTTLRAAPGARVLLNPTIPYPGGGGVVTTVFQGSFLEFDGLHVDAGFRHTHGIYLGGSHVRYRNAEVTRSSHSGVASQANTSFVEMINLHVHHNNGHGFYVCGTDKLIEHNYVHDNGLKISSATDNHMGIQVSCEQGGIDRVVIRYNRVEHNPGVGIRLQSRGIVHDNLLINNSIGITAGTTVTIRNNTIYGHTPPYWFGSKPDSHAILGGRDIRNNLLVLHGRYIALVDGNSSVEYDPGDANTNLCDQPKPGCALVEANSGKIFVSASTGDFRLAPLSPASGAASGGGDIGAAITQVHPGSEAPPLLVPAGHSFRGNIQSTTPPQGRSVSLAGCQPNAEKEAVYAMVSTFLYRYRVPMLASDGLRGPRCCDL